MAAIVAAAALGVAGSLLALNGRTAGRESCKPAVAVLRYGDVRPVFEKRCNSCHSKLESDNHDAQRVFESSRYPFATERPKTLLPDLEKMFASRGGISDEERCSVLGWLADGARDDSGKKPPYAQGAERR